MAIVRGGVVVPHVQGFADEASRRFGLVSFGTYPGHQPDMAHGLDCFGTYEQMYALAEWANDRPVIRQFGIDYIIFNVNRATIGGEIWNPDVAEMWRQMANRGGPTQNHWDHDHLSFEKVAAGYFPDLLTPRPSKGIRREEDMIIVRPGEALPYPVPAGAKNGLVSCEFFGQEGGCRAAIIVGNHPEYHGAFGPEVVTVGQGTSAFPIQPDDNFIRVHNLGPVPLVVGTEF